MRGEVYKTVECVRCSHCRTDRWKVVKRWKDANPEKDAASYHRWREKNKFRVLSDARRSKFKNKYGITISDYDKMFSDQGGVCKICSGPGLKNKRLSVDHDHKTGQVRGLLCHGCNVMLGLAKDGPFRLHAAVDYLEGLHASGRLIRA